MNWLEKDDTRLLREMQDYSQIGMDLIWQRQIIFAAALGLAAYYYSVEMALVCLGLTLVAEVYDYLTFRAVLAVKQANRALLKHLHLRLILGTVLSAFVIIYYSIGIAIKQGPTTHFMPLFFLFAASLFAAMNNHHLISVLLIRMILYGLTFILIPARDIYITDAPLSSELWAQFFTSIFVLYFILDSSRIYLNFYRTRLAQMDDLKQEHENTQKAYRAKSEFLATMSHELRTPLTSMRGGVDLVASGKLGALPEKASSVLALAQRNAQRLLGLIDEILDLQKIESGKMDFTMETFDIGGAVAESVQINHPYAEKLGVTVQFSAPKRSFLVHADKMRLEQVFANILSNAAKFSPEGSEVTVSLLETKGGVQVRFSDQGVGLDDTDAERVFDQFSQLDASDTRKIGGTGLGMNISRKIMEALGGSIHYLRNPDRGTTFIIDLPRA